VQDSDTVILGMLLHMFCKQQHYLLNRRSFCFPPPSVPLSGHQVHGPPRVLLVGPPGNGKTLMARAVAGESGVAFISSSASEFIEMYMGLGRLAPGPVQHGGWAAGQLMLLST